jgi:hypothetical protein
VAKNGVRVTMISPGFIETSGAHGMIMDISKGTGVSEEAARQQIMDMLGGIPVGRPGTPEEVQIYRSRFSTYQLQIGTNRITAVRQAHCDWSCPELGTATTRPHRDFLKEDKSREGKCWKSAPAPDRSNLQRLCLILSRQQARLFCVTADTFRSPTFRSPNVAQNASYA